MVLPAGIEPAFPPSEGDVLSIERRKRAGTIAPLSVLFPVDDRGGTLLKHRETRSDARLSVSVLPVGIEPTLQAPQACVLSIERREQYVDCSVSRAYSQLRA